MALRAMPHLDIFRPADANETTTGWKVAMTSKLGPTGLVLSRQDLPIVTPPGAPAEKGAYVLADGDDAIVIASGSEVATALDARTALAKDGIHVRVVSMPSWELFDRQDAAYRESVLPAARWQRVSIEAGVTFGWERYIGQRGIAIGVDRYGASAPGEIVLDKLGVNAGAVTAAVKKLVGK